MPTASTTNTKGRPRLNQPRTTHRFCGRGLFNWVVAFVGNFVGAFMAAVLMFYTTQYTFG
jgi:formate/nitrite transporter FocA (FNT family)